MRLRVLPGWESHYRKGYRPKACYRRTVCGNLEW
jgi:hypothetical protein